MRSRRPHSTLPFSPDGRWVAYTLRGGGANIYVEPFPATGAKHQITTDNGHHPVWLPGGKGLSYRVGANEQVVVAIDATAGFTFGIPQHCRREGPSRDRGRVTPTAPCRRRHGRL